jgi:hypothetical protein
MTKLKSRAVTEAVADAKAVRARVQRDYDPSVRQARKAARRARLARRAKRFTALGIGGVFALIVASIAWSIIVDPLGILGILLVLMLIPAVLAAAIYLSGERKMRPQNVSQAASLPAIAARADEFLHQQRRALPAPAQDLTDLIGQRLASMGPQLEAINPAAPEAHELRRMIGEELPDLLTKYRAVPPHLRREDRNGRVPEQELIDGLQLLDARIDDTQRQIAAADMDRLSSHKRYLELRYSGDEVTNTQNPVSPPT